MAHGGFIKRRVKPAAGLGVEKKPKTTSLKNQIRAVERMLRQNLPPEAKEAQEKKLEGLKKQQDAQTRLALDRKMVLRDRKIKFFERRKIDRRIRRLERLQRTSAEAQVAQSSVELSKLKEDLEYVKFFPKTEKYVPLFTGGDDSEVVGTRNRLRKQIKANIIAAAASGKDLEETGTEDDRLLDISEDDFFLNRSSSDGESADDEWNDKSAREQASSASGKAASEISSDEKNQRQISARALMPPPRPSSNNHSSSTGSHLRFGPSSRKSSVKRTEVSAPSSRKSSFIRTDVPGSSSSKSSFKRTEVSRSCNPLSSRSGISFKAKGSSSSGPSGAIPSSNLSSNSDAHKPRRKRRPKKKKQQVRVECRFCYCFPVVSQIPRTHD